jgi:hypothetical protein
MNGGAGRRNRAAPRATQTAPISEYGAKTAVEQAVLSPSRLPPQGSERDQVSWMMAAGSR